jgi:SOS response regulatory protein OraA/RecX
MDQETYNHIREKIIDYLSRQGFSERKLLLKVTKLRERYPYTARYAGYISCNVQEVIDDLKAKGIVNDESYARDVLRQLKNKKDGPERIRQKLYRRLVPKEVIELVMSEFAHEGFTQDFSRFAHDVIRKNRDLVEKHGKSKKASYIIWKKIYAYLAQKGYYPEDIRIIMKKAGCLYTYGSLEHEG